MVVVSSSDYLSEQASLIKRARKVHLSEGISGAKALMENMILKSKIWWKVRESSWRE